MKIYVKNNDISRALKVLKKKLYEEGETRELRSREHFTPAGEQRRLAKKAGIKRWRKKQVKLEQIAVRKEQQSINKNKRKRPTKNINKPLA